MNAGFCFIHREIDKCVAAQRSYIFISLMPGFLARPIHRLLIFVCNESGGRLLFRCLHLHISSRKSRPPLVFYCPLSGWVFGVVGGALNYLFAFCLMCA